MLLAIVILRKYKPRVLGNPVFIGKLESFSCLAAQVLKTNSSLYEPKAEHCGASEKKAERQPLSSCRGLKASASALLLRK